MTNNRLENINGEKLVKIMPAGEADSLGLNIPLTKKRAYRIRRIALPYIRAHKVKGRTFYTYTRGTDREIYLGTADAILEAVSKNKLATGKNRPC